MTIQEKIKIKLMETGIPAKRIDCYGSQIVVTAWSRNAAEKWASVLAKFSTVKVVKESMDYNKENANTVLLPSAHKVWRVWAVI